MEGKIESLTELISAIEYDLKQWNMPECSAPWFRGQSSIKYELIPSIFRKTKGGTLIDEQIISRLFRKRAGALGNVPESADKQSEQLHDQWLYLMQHVGVPTRLLDWTESALVAVYFAVHKLPETDSVVWMLNPLELNRIAIGRAALPASYDDDVWSCFRSAYSERYIPNKLYPIAILPKHSHPRMAAQRSCFTIHGAKQFSFEEMFIDTLIENGFLRKYIINQSSNKRILKELGLLGIKHATVFPDLDGLAVELKMEFGGSI